MIRRSLTRASAMLIAAMTAQAQIEPEPPTVGERGIWSADIGGLVARPTGGFSSNVDVAWGVGLAVRHHFRSFKPLGLRGDIAFLNYGNETKRVPLSPTVNRVIVDMTTSNNIAVFSGGPELQLTVGPVQPYVYGFAGYSYFFTQSSVGGDYEGDFASSENFSDGGLATGWGGGVSIPLRLRRARIAIDAGARQTINGTRRYLRKGDIQDLSDGSLLFTPRTTDANFWQFHVGASFGLGRS
jgi:hypothetical protein